MTEKSKREIAREDYYKVLDKIIAARNSCHRKRIIAIEVWLGPKEREILAFNWLLDREELMFCYGIPTSNIFSTTVDDLVLKLKDSTFYGLKVRFSEEDGVWAGISFGV